MTWTNRNRTNGSKIVSLSSRYEDMRRWISTKKCTVHVDAFTFIFESKSVGGFFSSAIPNARLKGNLEGSPICLEIRINDGFVFLDERRICKVLPWYQLFLTKPLILDTEPEKFSTKLPPVSTRAQFSIGSLKGHLVFNAEDLAYVTEPSLWASMPNGHKVKYAFIFVWVSSFYGWAG